MTTSPRDAEQLWDASRAVTTVANAGTDVSLSEIRLPAGTWLTEVAVEITGYAPENGEIYISVHKNKIGANGPVTNEGILLLSGYILSGEGLSSIPNLRVGPSEALYFQAYSGTDAAGALVTVRARCTTLEPAGSPVFCYRPPGPASGPGHVRLVASSDPAAGSVPGTITVPSNVMWRLRSAFCQGVMAAVAASRQLAGEIDDGTNVYAAWVQGGVSASGETTAIFVGLGQDTNAATSRRQTSGMPDVLMLEAHRIVHKVNNIDPGDDYTAVRYEVEEWADPSQV